MADELKFRLQAGEVVAFIDGTINKLRQVEPLLQNIMEKEVKAAKNRIKKTKKSPDGTPWAPWSPSTKQARTRKGNAAQGLLYDTGRLHDSFESKVANKSISIWNTAPYAKFLQNGTPKMPAREFLGWSAKTKKDMEELLKAHFTT